MSDPTEIPDPRWKSVYAFIHPHSMGNHIDGLDGTEWDRIVVTVTTCRSNIDIQKSQIVAVGEPINKAMDLIIEEIEQWLVLYEKHSPTAVTE